MTTDVFLLSGEVCRHFFSIGFILDVLTLNIVNASIEQLRKVIEDMYDKETDKMNNLPESLQEVTSGQSIADAIEMLEDKLNALDNISEGIESSFSE